MLKRSVILAGLVPFIGLILSVPNVNAVEEGSVADNILENQLNDIQTMLSALGENLSSQSSDLSALESSVSNLVKHLSNQSAELGGLRAHLENLASEVSDLRGRIEEEELGQMTVMAWAHGKPIPLSFGGFPGGTSPMLMMMQGGELFTVENVPPMTPLVTMSEGRLVEDASITLYVTGENMFRPMNLPVFNGVSLLPNVSGIAFGEASAPGFEDVGFFVRIGGREGGEKMVGGVEFHFLSAPVEKGKGEIMEVTVGGEKAGGNVTITYEDGTQDRFAYDGETPISFVPKTGKFAVSFSSATISESRTFYTEGAYHGAGEGKSYLYLVPIAVLIALGGYFVYRFYWRREKAEKVPLG